MHWAAQTTASERTLKNRNRKTHEVFSFLQNFWRTTTMNTTIDFKTAKTIENMSRKIDGMERAVSGFFNKMSDIAERK
jgi:hypothetical protein